MASPLIISGGGTRQLGTGALEVNSIEAITGSTITVGTTSETVTVVGSTTFRRASSNATISVTPIDSSATGVQVNCSADGHWGIWVNNSATGKRVIIKPENIEAGIGQALIISGGISSSSASGNLSLQTAGVTGTFISGDVNISTGNVIGAANAGDIKIYTGFGQSSTQSGGIVIEANGGSTVTPVDRQIDLSAPLDVKFTARGGSVTLNQTGNTALLGFTATSIIGALNEARSNLKDTDGDTFVKVEASPDEDIIRINSAGNEVARFSDDGFYQKIFNPSGDVEWTREAINNYLSPGIIAVIDNITDTLSSTSIGQSGIATYVNSSTDMLVNITNTAGPSVGVHAHMENIWTRSLSGDQGIAFFGVKDNTGGSIDVSSGLDVLYQGWGGGTKTVSVLLEDPLASSNQLRFHLEGGNASIRADAGDINFRARGSSAIPFNDASNVSLSNFAATSVIGALNELKTAEAQPFASGFPSYGEKKIFYGREDFLSNNVGFYGYFSAQSGTGATVNIVAGTAGRIGVAHAVTGTDTTGYALITSGGSGVIFNSGRQRLRMDVCLTTLSDGTDTYTARCGYSNNNSGAEAGNAIYFRYTHSVNSGRWQAVVRKSGVETSFDTGVTATTNWICFEIEVNEAGTSAVFYINGALVATASSGLPTGTSEQLGIIPVAITKSAGTSSRTIQIDFVEWSYEPTTPL